jgi:hypothetical protein
VAFRRQRDQSTGNQADLTRATSVVTSAVIGIMRDPNGRVHSETAITAIASTAGTLLLRETLGAHLDGLEPGSAGFGDDVDEKGRQVLQHVMDVAAQAGVTWDASANPIPAENRPHGREIDLVRQVEPGVVRTLCDQRVDKSAWPICCALSALDLVVRTSDVLDTAVATRLLVAALVAGCKTVPYRTD